MQALIAQELTESIPPLNHAERRELIETPIQFNYYGGKSSAGTCTMGHRDTAYYRYLRAWRQSQTGEGSYLA